MKKAWFDVIKPERISSGKIIEKLEETYDEMIESARDEGKIRVNLTEINADLEVLKDTVEIEEKSEKEKLKYEILKHIHDLLKNIFEEKYKTQSIAESNKLKDAANLLEGKGLKLQRTLGKPIPTLERAVELIRKYYTTEPGMNGYSGLLKQRQNTNTHLGELHIELKEKEKKVIEDVLNKLSLEKRLANANRSGLRVFNPTFDDVDRHVKTSYEMFGLPLSKESRKATVDTILQKLRASPNSGAGAGAGIGMGGRGGGCRLHQKKGKNKKSSTKKRSN